MDIYSKYKEFMKVNGRKINNGTFPSKKLQIDINHLLKDVIEEHNLNKNDIKIVSMLIELNKASHDYVTAIRYINKLLKLDPKNRKYISEKQEFLDKKSKVSQPISENEIKDLIVYLNNQGTDCSHEFINVKRWASLNQIDNKRLIQWLNDNGAFCDCEVLYNFDEVWYVKPYVPSIQ